MSAEEPLDRVAMMWPRSVKEQVRLAVGPRGLTEFVLEAVGTKLETLTPEERTRFEPKPQPKPDPRAKLVPPLAVTQPEKQVPAPQDVGPEPALLVDDEEKCPRCENPLIAGECWTCMT